MSKVSESTNSRTKQKTEVLDSSTDIYGQSNSGSNNEAETTALKPTTASITEAAFSPDSSNSEESPITFSDSSLFPTSTDAIWQSLGFIPEAVLGEDIFDTEEDDDEQLKLLPAEDNDNSHLDDETSDEEEHVKEILYKANVGEDTGTDGAPALSVAQVLSVAPSSPTASMEDPGLCASDEDDQPLLTVECTTEQTEVPRLSSAIGDSPSQCKQESTRSLVDTRLLMKGKEDSPQIALLNQRLAQLVPPGAGDDVKVLKDKFENGLQFLDDLAHANLPDDTEMKYIYDAYHDFGQPLFKEIGRPSAAKASSISGHASSDIYLSRLEQQKEKITEQEKLLEKEILHYKTTKRELQMIAGKIEEASKSYRKPEILEDVEIPRDIKFSSSSEYVAEIGELQAEILKKQETLKEMRKEIQCRFLPKALVDSVCESHRLAMQALRDIEEETAYLKECVSRLDTKYLYNLQIS